MPWAGDLPDHEDRLRRTTGPVTRGLAFMGNRHGTYRDLELERLTPTMTTSY
jgi:hypothetical protein